MEPSVALELHRSVVRVRRRPFLFLFFFLLNKHLHQVPLCYIQCKSLSQSSRHATMMPKFSSVCSQAVSLFSPSVISRMQRRTSSLRPQSLFLKSFFNLNTNEGSWKKVRAWIRQRDCSMWRTKRLKSRLKKTQVIDTELCLDQLKRCLTTKSLLSTHR